MSNTCYKCGRRKCEACGGTGATCGAPDFIGEKIGPGSICTMSECLDCEKGWREAERMPLSGKCQFPARLVGEDESILCPECEGENA
ncbi:MAG: hypothetical protein V3W37_10000 [Candidatus Binatia bacterium]